MAAFGVEGSGDIAGVAGVGTGGDAQAWQSLADWFFPMGVFGVGGPGTGFDAPNGGYGVCGLGYSPTPLSPQILNPSDAVGVYGQGGAGSSTGVVGVGTGSYSGVLGIADPNQVANGTGVVGRGGLSTGIGVWGSGGSEHFTATPPPGNAIGVFGAAGSGNADGVYGVGSGSSSGVVGIGDPNSNTANGTGMHGVGGLPTGVGVWGNGASPPGAATAAPPPGNAIGVFGAGGSGDSDGVYGSGSGHGYGGQFASGFAPMRLVPAAAGTGHPTGAPHNVGEFYVDSHGSLFYCRRSGTPGTWVKLA